MAIGDPYITGDDLVAWGQVPLSDDDVVLLDPVCAAASRGVNRFCGRQFQQSTGSSSREFEAVSAQLVVVHDFHSLNGLVVEHGVNGSWSNITSSVVAWPLDGIVDGEPGWPYHYLRPKVGNLFTYVRGAPTIRLTTDAWGWAAVPDDVVLATKLVAARWFSRRDSQNGVIGFAETSIRVSQYEDPDAVRLLMPYQRERRSRR